MLYIMSEAYERKLGEILKENNTWSFGLGSKQLIHYMG